MIDAIEPHQSDDNEIDRDDEVQQPRHDQNEDAGDKGDKRRDMGGGDDHGFASGLGAFQGRDRMQREIGRALTRKRAVRFYATNCSRCQADQAAAPSRTRESDLPLDLGKIGHGAGRGADFVEQF